MKNRIQTILSLFILFVICTCYGQKNYKFDKIVNNTFSTESFPNQKRTNLFNSEDYSYHMQIYNRNDSLMSRIFDTKENKVHYFYIDKSDSLKLYYRKTEKMTKYVPDNKFEFSEIQEKKGKKEIVFKILDNKDKKIAKYKLKIKETDKNYFSVFRLTSLEPQLYNNIKPNTNFIILEAKGTNISGNFVKYKLESIEDIDLNITIPK